MNKKVCKKEVSILFVLYLIVLKYLIKNRKSTFALYLCWLIIGSTLREKEASEITGNFEQEDNNDKNLSRKNASREVVFSVLAEGVYYYNARWYDPGLGRFITEDPARAGNNWFIYANNSPLRYTDPTGLAPKNLTDDQREIYMDYVSNLAVTDTIYDHDCADLATAIYSMGLLLSTDGFYKHQDLTHNGTNISRVPEIQSSDFFPENTNNITFYDDKKFNSPDIEVGTVAVWESDDKDVWTGHVATITGVKRDDAGNVLQIDIIEGYKGDKATEKVKITSQSDLDEYLGTFHGWGEIGENSTSESTGENND